MYQLTKKVQSRTPATSTHLAPTLAATTPPSTCGCKTMVSTPSWNAVVIKESMEACLGQQVAVEEGGEHEPLFLGGLDERRERDANVGACPVQRIHQVSITQVNYEEQHIQKPWSLRSA